MDWIVDWTTGLDCGLDCWTDYWTGLLTAGLVDWTTGLDYWTGLWTGLVDWTTGLDCGLDCWTRLLDWTAGVDYCLDFCFTSLPPNQMCRFGCLPYVLISSSQFMHLSAEPHGRMCIMISWCAHSEIKQPVKRAPKVLTKTTSLI